MKGEIRCLRFLKLHHRFWQHHLISRMTEYMTQFMAKILPLLLSGKPTVDDNAVNHIAINRCASDICKMKLDV
jgi:hypothetical protein